MTQRFLTKKGEEDLILYIAVNGENYEAYKKYATQNSWPVYTPSYFHTWVNRRRGDINSLRATHRATMIQDAGLHRQARLNLLEDNSRVLQERIDEWATDPDVKPELLMKLMEQQRKLMQAIAVERGEWNKAEKPDDGSGDMYAKLIDQMKENLQISQKANTVDAEYREV